jgi:hypothetical protein
MLKKDFDLHEKEGCELVEVTCLKCGVTYNQRQEHTEAQCLEKQLLIIKEKLNAAEKYSQTMEENCKKMEEKLKREQKNEEYARRTEPYNKSFNCEYMFVKIFSQNFDNECQSFNTIFV